MVRADGVPNNVQSKDWWYLVVNFDSARRQGNTYLIQSCLRMGNTAGGTKAFAGVCRTEGDVKIRNGNAIFNGGIVICDRINIGETGVLAGIPLKGESKEALSFWVAMKGMMSRESEGAAPLLRYVPADANTGAVAFNVTPATTSQPRGFAATTSPESNLQGRGLTIAVKPASPFTGLFTAFPDESGLLYRWRLGSKVIAEETVPASFTQIGIGESTLYIGGTPEGPHFKGTLDYIVFDPIGGGRTG